MFFRTYSATLIGVNSRIIEVEVDFKKGLPNNTIVGLPDPAIREARERVNAAIRNSGFEFPIGRLTVNLAPAQLKKEGTSFDMAIATGILLVSNQIKSRIDISRLLLIGELALDGMIRPVRGIIAIVQEAREKGILYVVLPKENMNEASLVSGIKLVPVERLKEVAEIFASEESIEAKQVTCDRGVLSNRKMDKPGGIVGDRYASIYSGTDEGSMDFSEVIGQEYVKRAAQICIAGAHNMLLIGSPGSGKTMVASRLPTIMPDLSEEESIETTKIYSIAGLLVEGFGLMKKRPFRAPHSTASNVSIIGGGKNPIPGEITLAHNGVLFLDEFPEFNRNVIQALRQPVENGSITISRADTRITFPARFILVGSMNPCPCGYLFDSDNECHCDPRKVRQYYMKLSAPILDRFDLQVVVNPLKIDSMITPDRGTNSSSIKQGVLVARETQNRRFKDMGGGYYNSNMNDEEVEKYCVIKNDVKKLLFEAARIYNMSMRGFQKVLKVARTIADLDQKENIGEDEVLEALNYRGVSHILSSYFRNKSGLLTPNSSFGKK